MVDKCSVAYCRAEYQVSTPSGRYCDYHNGIRLDEMLAELRRDGVRNGTGDK